MKIFLVRHGQTDHGKKRYTTGQLDIPLNETGKEEALTTAKYLKGRNIVTIFTSSLSRASETARIIASELSLPVIEHDELMEHSSGKLDGVPIEEFFEKLRSAGDFEEMILQAGGEPWIDFKERVWGKFTEVVKEDDALGNILIVTHGVVIRHIFSEIFDSPFLKVLSLGNCCVNIIDYNVERDDDLRFIVELVNYTHHHS